MCAPSRGPPRDLARHLHLPRRRRRRRRWRRRLREAARRGVQVKRGGRRLRLQGDVATLREWHVRGRRRSWRCSGPSTAGGTGCSRASCGGLHQKLCVVDGEVAFVGGINLIDDRNDLNHGWSEAPRLDFAVEVARPGGRAEVEQTVQAMWTRAHARPRVARRNVAWRAAPNRWRAPAPGDAAAHRAATGAPAAGSLPPVRARLRAARQPAPAPHHRAQPTWRRSARAASASTWSTPYFYPGPRLPRGHCAHAARARRARAAAAAGQDRLPYRGLAARVLYDEMLRRGVRIFEYTPASCMPRWRSSTTTGRRWAAPTSIRCRCC